MWAIRAAAVWVFALGCFSPACARESLESRGPGNLIYNSGMEATGAEGVPGGWFPRLQEAPEKTVEVRQAAGGHNSPRCLLLTSTANKVIFGAYCQPVDIPEGTRELIVSFYSRTKATPMADVYVLIYKDAFAEREWDTPFIQAEDRAIPQSDGWSLMAWRFRLLPGAKQALVAFRATGAGSLYVDDVALRPYPQVVSCDVLFPGVVTSLPSQRGVILRLKAYGSPPPLTASLVLTSGRRSWVAWQQRVNLKTDEAATVTGQYSLAYDETCRGVVTVTGRAADEVYVAEPVRVPALLDGRIRSPAFRSTLLRALPDRAIEAVGCINASQALAEKVTLSAALAGTGREATQGAGIDRSSALTWRVAIDGEGLLSGKYELQVTASVERKSFSLSLPLSVAPEVKECVAYDHRGALWTSGQARLPVGIYYATTAEDLARARAAGYNFSVIPWTLASTAVMDAAAAMGMKVMVHSRSLETSFWRHAADKFGQHSALLGWHLVGKPDAELTPPSVIAETARILADLDPFHPIATTLSMPSEMAEYTPALDVVLAWTDPIPQSGPVTVGIIVDQAREAAGGKPVWALIQSVGHAWSWDRRLNKTGEGRLPTPAEHRCMRYLALIHGARGLLDYSFVLDAGQRGESFVITRDAPELWAAIARTNRELAAIEPFIARGDWHPVQLSVDEPVQAAYWTTGDFLLMIAVNTSAEPAVSALPCAPVTHAMLTNVFTGEKFLGTPDGQFGLQIEPYGVAVLAGRLSQ
ncbi:MAG: hypothetical protein N2512_03000 [Armatimonadetes bacterium]|nr:hypothetical protein [Armatimonadota bacterium]